MKEGRTKTGQWAKGHKAPDSHRIPKGARVSPKTEYKRNGIPWNATATGTPRWHSRDGWVTSINVKTIARTRGKKYRKRITTSYARYLWMKYRGSIPFGMVAYVGFQDQNHVPTIRDIELITRAELARRNKE